VVCTDARRAGSRPGGWAAGAGKAVDLQMLETLGRTQGQPAAAFGELLGVPFADTPRLIECGSTTLQADVPGQTPILPLATSAAAVIGASELIKQATGRPGLDNWLAHDLRRNPDGPWRQRRDPFEAVHTTPHTALYLGRQNDADPPRCCHLPCLSAGRSRVGTSEQLVRPWPGSGRPDP
jgi:hypothetical protein